MADAERRRWTRDELLLALHLYWRIPFGQQHKGNRQVIELAMALGRTPSSVAMKLSNLTSLDAAELARGVKGLPGASALDAEVWQEFQTHHETVAAESEGLWRTRVEGLPAGPPDVRSGGAAPERATETSAQRVVRLGQEYFRRVVLENFDGRCALTGMAHPALVNASHIVSWAEDTTHRLDPANGIALNRLHDAAFDRYLITFDDKLRMVVGRAVRDSLPRDELAAGFLAYEGQPLAQPVRHILSQEMLARHRSAFQRANA
jgi:predicted restriction endonuclease